MDIKKAFEKAKRENRLALIPYFTAGYPDLNTSYKVFLTMAEQADIIEIGLPFSDPLADGPTIQKSSSSALAKGIDTDKALAIARRLRKKTNVPIALMTYYNILLGYGLSRFAKKAKDSGINSVIIPDLPPEEASDWLNANGAKLETIFLASPTSSEKRLKLIAKKTSGFIYCVSVTGVTGSRSKLDKGVKSYLRRVKKVSTVPLAVGFGLSSASQVKELKGLADGVIVGSAFINIFETTINKEKALAKISNLMKSLKTT